MVKKKKKKRVRREKRKEQTLIIIKPDGVQKKLISRILFRFEKNGLHIRALKMVKLKKTATKKLFYNLKDRLNSKLFNSICNWMASAPVVIGLAEGFNAVKKAKKITGPTNPQEAYRGTIRGDFAVDDLVKRTRMNLPTRNIIHVSSSKGEAKKEIELFKNLLRVRY